MQKTAGFTIKQAQEFRRLSKASGVDADFEKCAQVSSALLSALAGAGIGGGAGLISDAIRPVDEDEDRKKRRVAALLGGILLGGVAGAGYDQFKKETPLLFTPKRSTAGRVFDAIDPSPSTVLAAGGIGYWAKPHFSNGGRIPELLDRDMKRFVGQPALSQRDPANRELLSALNNYDQAVSHGKTRSRVNSIFKFLTGGRLKPFEETTAARTDEIRQLAHRLRQALDRNTNMTGVLNMIRGSSGGHEFLGNTQAHNLRIAKAFSHAVAKARHSAISYGRAGRGAALLAGLLALGYKVGK